jgi:hypothetical protein
VQFNNLETINSNGDYDSKYTVAKGKLNERGDVDRFWIKIWKRQMIL